MRPMVRILKCGVNGNERDFLPNGREVTVLGGLERQVKLSAGMTGTALRRREATNERQRRLRACWLSFGSSLRSPLLWQALSKM